MLDDEQREHSRLMDAHRNRKEYDFIPYWCRRSDGRCDYVDLGSHVVVILEVKDLGTLTLSVEPQYNWRTATRWNQDAILRARIK